jgi:sugar (pentulose or hexulose) kinase
VGGASNLGGWLLRSHFSNKELVDLSLQLEDTLTREANEGNLASKETVTDYFPSVLMGFGLSVQDAASALAANRPTSDVAFLRNILHSIANVEARSYAKFVEMGASHEVTKVLTAGGGAQNEVWSGIRSTELGGVFVGKALHIEAAFGTALLARMGHYGLETYVPVIELRKED